MATDAFGIDREEISKKWKKEYQNAALTGAGIAGVAGGVQQATRGANQILAGRATPGQWYASQSLKLRGKQGLVRGAALTGLGATAIALGNKRTAKPKKKA